MQRLDGPARKTASQLRSSQLPFQHDATPRVTIKTPGGTQLSGDNFTSSAYKQQKQQKFLPPLSIEELLNASEQNIKDNDDDDFERQQQSSIDDNSPNRRYSCISNNNNNGQEQDCEKIRKSISSKLNGATGGSGQNQQQSNNWDSQREISYHPATTLPASRRNQFLTNSQLLNSYDFLGRSMSQCSNQDTLNRKNYQALRASESKFSQLGSDIQASLSAVKRAKQIEKDLKILEEMEIKSEKYRKQDSFLERQRTKRKQSKMLLNYNTQGSIGSEIDQDNKLENFSRRSSLASCSGGGKVISQLTPKNSNSIEIPLHRVISPGSDDKARSISRSRKGWDMPLQLPVIKESMTKMNQIQVQISTKIKEKERIEKEIQDMRNQLKVHPRKSDEDIESQNSKSIRQQMIKDKIQNDKLFTPRKSKIKNRNSDQILRRSVTTQSVPTSQNKQLTQVPRTRTDMENNQKTVKLAKYLEEKGIKVPKNQTKKQLSNAFNSERPLNMEDLQNQQFNPSSENSSKFVSSGKKWKSKQQKMNEKLMIQAKKWAQKRTKRENSSKYFKFNQGDLSEREEEVSFRTPSRKQWRIQPQKSRVSGGDFSLSLTRKQSNRKEPMKTSRKFQSHYNQMTTPPSRPKLQLSAGKKTPYIAEGIKMSWNLNSEIPQFSTGEESSGGKRRQSIIQSERKQRQNIVEVKSQRNQIPEKNSLDYYHLDSFKNSHIQFNLKSMITEPRLMMPKNIFQSAEYRRVMYSCASSTPKLPSNFNVEAELRKSKDRFHFY